MGHASSNQGRRRRRDQGGYALLAIFVAAAAAAILLARALPRDAMRAQRLREERLIMRGEQYTRGIELYFREHKKYPEELDDLEDTNGVRYLRRRYKDPITGEDEWRLIHIGVDGRFKDSLVYDTEDEEEGYGLTDGGFGSGSRSTPGQRRRSPAMQTASAPAYFNPGGFAGAERARQVRTSAAPDPLGASQGGGLGQYGSSATDPNDPNAPSQPAVGPDGQPLPPQDQPDYTRVRPGDVPLNAGQRPPRQAGGAIGGQPYPQSASQQPTSQQRGGAFRSSGGRTGGGFGAQGGFAGQRPGSAGAPQQQGGTPAGFGRQGIAPEAANIIQRLLTTPRPGGLAGLRQGQAGVGGPGQGGQAFQEGVAGVASKSTELGVKVYKGRETYSEWEFVYDYREDQGLPGMAGGNGQMGPGVAGGQPGVTPSGLMGTPPASGIGGFLGGMGGRPNQPGQSPTRARRDPRQTRPSMPTATPNLPPSVFGSRQPTTPTTPTTPPPPPGVPGQPGNPLFPGVGQPGQPPQQPQPEQSPQPQGPFRLRDQRQSP